MVGECLGAKNKPRVDCYGDERLCLFYSDRRRKAKAVTNGDRIRSMSDEELADFITDDMCGLICGDPLACEGQCKQKMLDWLKEEEKG